METVVSRHGRLEEYAPKTGTVRVLRLTEKQYSNIHIIAQEYDYQRTYQEEVIGKNCHIML